ncbi:GNAT family N-acetyltransferase [Flagellimonas zhangzhouensis]|uniref:Ribosomal protein S18 acetylase RimI n=1 Tax=Flagellimonas zhangzhouensis TaxID=1073328 RepID=A0A1H2QWI4_9FLAO|nr:GNAT family N-acetyltransferase [Allomuricauda zhangzhouensis]SDQ56870.1 Ribosomal protein S18 acetylase RimI [Allomuricauda zhangzhouensis]SDW10809.1 Ribosomal protein S18 acetylase RimI [Allomuricauda zhangzhouensis]
MDLNFIPVTLANLDTYLEVGVKSYREHYLHLWTNADPTPYISYGLTKSVVEKELKDPNASHYLINCKGETVGILKLVLHCGIDEITPEEALKAEKIYFLKEHSGKGLGKQTLQWIETKAKSLNKKLVWLDTMQKGNPIHFYQKNGYVIKRESEVILPGVLDTEKPMWILTKKL